MLKVTLLFCLAALLAMQWLPEITRHVVLPGQQVAKVDRLLPPLKPCRVIIIYDGDTLGCDMDRDGRITAQQEHVRLLGIDATEMVYSRKNKTGRNQPYAQEATDALARLTLNKTIYLEADRYSTDKYDRTLAYAYLEPERKRMANRLMLQMGLARMWFLGTNRRYEALFSRDEARAMEVHLALWSSSVATK